MKMRARPTCSWDWRQITLVMLVEIVMLRFRPIFAIQPSDLLGTTAGGTAQPRGAQQVPCRWRHGGAGVGGRPHQSSGRWPGRRPKEEQTGQDRRSQSLTKRRTRSSSEHGLFTPGPRTRSNGARPCPPPSCRRQTRWGRLQTWSPGGSILPTWRRDVRTSC